MKQIAKIVAYVVLIACVAGFGYGFLSRLPHARGESEPGEPTNTMVLSNTPAGTTNAAVAAARPAASQNWGTFLGMFLLTSISLGLLAAYDLSRYFAHRAEQFVFDENLVVEKDPEYEEAEKIWANGKPLEAVQLMRDFLKNNPQAQYVALRIAEIYEKDLGNHLAAALEYEEVLKKKLPAERWGWAAIHLANLYSGKLNKVPQAEALLHRIVEEVPQTGAAKKARERLGIPEPIVQPEVQPEPAAPKENEEPEEPSGPPPPPPTNLPPGFRPKS